MVHTTGRFGENLIIEGINGSYGWPIIGHTFDYLSDTYAFGRSMRAQYGEVYRCSAFLQRFIVFNSPAGAELVLKDEANQFSSKLGWEAFLGRLFPHSLPTMDFEEHRHHRRIMQSVFKKQALIGYVSLIDQVVQDNLNHWPSNQSMQAYPAIKALTLDIAARAFLGLELEDDADFINRNFVDLNNGLAAIVPWPLPGTALQRALKARARIFDYFSPLIHEKRNSNGQDIFSRLCQAQDENGQDFSDEAILYHLSNILAAAHDTSTTSLTITLDLLCRHPEWQQRLRESCQRLDPNDVNFETLEQLEEIEWVFKEALRLYPPAPQLFRRSTQECQFGSHTIPSNTQVMVDCGYIHRSEEYWSNPMQFDPERFSPQRNEHKAHPYMWFPFGGGSHTCIGLRFAMMTAKLALYHLLRQFTFSAEGNSTYRILPITKPRNGLPIVLQNISKPMSSETRTN